MISCFGTETKVINKNNKIILINYSSNKITLATLSNKNELILHRILHQNYLQYDNYYILNIQICYHS